MKVNSLLKKVFGPYLFVVTILLGMLSLHGMENANSNNTKAAELATDFKQYLEDTIVKMEFSGTYTFENKSLDIFYSSAKPHFSISKYFDRLNNNLHLTTDQIFLAKKYIEKFIIKTGLDIGHDIKLIIYRAVFAAILLAIKNTTGYTHSNNTYAKYGCININELQILKDNFRRIMGKKSFYSSHEELELEQMVNPTKVKPIGTYCEIDDDLTLITGVKKYLEGKLDLSEPKNTPLFLRKFSSQYKPEISFSDYFDRLEESGDETNKKSSEFFFSSSDFALATICIDRFIDAAAEPINIFTIHRIFATALILAKAYNEEWDDIIFKDYVKVTLINKDELVRLHKSFLNIISFNLYVSQQEWDHYITMLMQLGETDAQN